MKTNDVGNPVVVIEGQTIVCTKLKSAEAPSKVASPVGSLSTGDLLAGSVVTLEDGTEILHDERTPTTRWTITRGPSGKISVTITQPTGIAHVTVGNMRLLVGLIERERWERPLPKHLSSANTTMSHPGGQS